MGLTAATYLGDNTVPALASLVDRVRTETGLDVTVDPAAGRSSSDARARASTVDLVWMCGALTVALTSQGELDHDVVAAPVFEGEQTAVYRSVIVGRADGPDDVAAALGGVLAVNEPESWSGHLAVRQHVHPAWFAGELLTGSHAASMVAVAQGRARCAAIDHSVWRHHVEHEPDLTAALRVMAVTQDWPAPPLLLSRRIDHGSRDRMVAAILRSGPLPGVAAMVPAQIDDYAPMAAEQP